MLYQSLKLTNGIWVLAELKIQPNNPNFMVSCYNHFNVYVRMSLEYTCRYKRNGKENQGERCMYT